jgi:segregation and condensation protein B
MVEEASVEEVIAQEFVVEAPAGPDEDAHLKAIIEAAIYITDEPLTPAQISAASGQPAERVNRLLDELTAEYNRAERGLSIREIAGGFKMATKPEHHEAIRTFVKNLKPPMKLSLPALETLAVIAYKQPVTAPEIMEIRGVQGIGVLKTLLDRKLIAAAGRKQVVGKPILYKTTKEFLVQFGLRDLAELPTLKEFEELGRLALSDEEEPVGAIVPADPSKDPEPIQEPGPEPQPERDPDPGENPGDPQHQPVKAESSSGLSEEDKEPAA